MSRDLLGCLNGLKKVGTSLSTIIASEINKEFGFVNVMSKRPVYGRIFYGELHFPNFHHYTIGKHSIDRNSRNMSKLNSSGVASGGPGSLQNGRQHHSCITPNNFVWRAKLNCRQLKNVECLARSICTDTSNNNNNNAAEGMKEKIASNHRKRRQKAPKERAVPASRASRLANFGGLAAGVGVGVASELARRALGMSSSRDVTALGEVGAAVLSEANVERLVTTLCKMRGAALKLGQMISLQDGVMLPAEVLDIFERVRNNADIMPAWQMESVLKRELGSEWRERLADFDPQPMAAASIGQVHRAVTKDGREVAMKIQYPGVAQSINSDIDNLVSLFKVWKVFPEGLFMEDAIDVMRKELAWESDYVRQAECARKFRSFLSADSGFVVPMVIEELSTKRVLTSELIHGVPLDSCSELAQEVRNEISLKVMSLCLRELCEFKFMQTDPNWSNFYYNDEDKKIYLLDFGSSRSYSDKFVQTYMELIHGSVTQDKDKIHQVSIELGFLTGYETKNLIDAHLEAALVLGKPFTEDSVFDFSQQSTTLEMHKLMPALLKDRLIPPPEEIYSIHRKMAGAFLLCTKLQAKINCHHMFRDAYESYRRSLS